MKKTEIKELSETIYQLVWNLCNEIACEDCYLYDHFNSIDDCPVEKLFTFANKVNPKCSEAN